MDNAVRNVWVRVCGHFCMFNLLIQEIRDFYYLSPGGEPEPQPCLFGKWSLWTKCSRTCGGGLQSRSRTYKIPENSDFVNCVGKLREVRRCLEDVCCPGDYY